MPFDFLTVDIPKATVAKLFFAGLTLLVAVLVDVGLRSVVSLSRNLQDKRAKTYAAVVKNGISFITFVIALYIILAILGVDITPLLASAGVIGIIIGLGTRQLVEDLIAGFFLVAQDSLAIGDYIKVDENEGHVETIGLRTLKVKALDGSLLILPNGSVRKIVNFSRRRSTIIIDLPVPGSEKIDKYMKVIQKGLEALKEEKDLKDDIISVKIDGVEDIREGNKVVVRVAVVTNPELRNEVSRRFRYVVKKEFEESKLEFA